MALTVADALARILSDVSPLETETVPLDRAQGRTLAVPLAAQLTQPPFDASAMDGYAVRAADVSTVPARLAIIGEAAAGHPFADDVATGQAVRIFTGAPLPRGTDAVVIQENTTRDGDGVVVREGSPDAGHVRKRGFDFGEGAILLAAGRRLGPRELSLAAAMGHGAVPVVRIPRVAIIATGDELVLPGETPGPGQIVCSNHLGVAALCRQAGAAAEFVGIARDTRQSLHEHFTRAAEADVVVTIGGASVGDHDLVGPVARDRGLALDFWKIAMRPGKPLMFGRMASQRLLGLPGNPVSSLICTRVFAIPLIDALLGRLRGAERLENVPTAVALEANGPRQHYMRATVQRDDDGIERVTPARSQDSSLLSPLAAANAFIVRPIGAPPVPQNDLVEILRLDF